MVLNIYVQTNAETGEKNVCLSADPLTDAADFAVMVGEWKNFPVLQGRVLILGMDDIGDGLVHAIADVELHGVDNPAYGNNVTRMEERSQ
jgi:hypothetical protein